MIKLRNLLTLLAMAASVLVLPACGKKDAKHDEMNGHSHKKEHHHRRNGKRNHKKTDRKERDRNFLFRK